MEQISMCVEGGNGQKTASLYGDLPQRLKSMLSFPFRGLAIGANHKSLVGLKVSMACNLTRIPNGSQRADLTGSPPR